MTEHFVSNACDYDICADCGISRFSHGKLPIACDAFVFSEEGRCEICTEREREPGGGKLFYFTHPSPPRSDYDR